MSATLAATEPGVSVQPHWLTLSHAYLERRWLYVPEPCPYKFLLGHSPATYGQPADEGLYWTVGSPTRADGVYLSGSDVGARPLRVFHLNATVGLTACCDVVLCILAVHR